MIDNNKMKDEDGRYRVLTGYVLGIFIIGLLPILACHTYDSFRSLKQGDFSLVFSGKYKEATTLLRDGAEYKGVVDRLRTEIEKNLFLLSRITKEHYDISGTLVYKFKFAALDSISNRLILRYFTRIYNHPLLAGYQVQLVFDAESRELVRIYTAEVPLE